MFPANKLSVALSVVSALVIASIGTPVEAMGRFLQDYGKISPSSGATRVFESYQVMQNYTYYYSGTDLYPNAVIGLDKAYTLDSDLWKEIKLTPGKLKEIIGYMKSKAIEVHATLHGFDILDPQGKKIGIWYSILEASTAVKMEEDNKVILYTPPQNVYECRGQVPSCSGSSGGHVL